jgi:hypothetical protein
VNQGAGGKPLAKHRGGLRRLFVGRVEPVDTGLNQTLDRAGHGNSLALIGVPKQLV